MNIDGMKFFCAVYDEGSIAQTAARYYLSHQAVSKRLAAIEKELGVPLFIRQPSGLTPTKAGTATYDTFCRILSEYQNLEDKLSQYRGKRPCVRIVVEPYCSETVDIDLLLQFEQVSSDNATINIEFRDSDECFQQVQDGRADIAIINEPTTDRDKFDYYLVDKAHALAMLAKNDPIAQRENLEPEDFEGYVLLGIAGARDTNKRINEVFVSRGIHVDMRTFSYDADSLRLLVRNGRGIHLIPNHLNGRFQEDSDLAFVRFPAADSVFEIGLALKRTDARPPYIEEFLTYALGHKEELIGL